MREIASSTPVSDTALVRNFKVEKVAWPDSKDAGEQKFTAFVESVVPEAGFEISMERLSASLATAEIEQKSLEQLKTDPPRIVFREELAVLLLYDGNPMYPDGNVLFDFAQDEHMTLFGTS